MPGPANQADKNSNTIISDAIIMFLQLYHTIFTTMTFLMPEPFSKSCQIAKVMKHIENPGIVRMLYSGIFRYLSLESNGWSVEILQLKLVLGDIALSLFCVLSKN